jgi:hypothetical protein
MLAFRSSVRARLLAAVVLAALLGAVVVQGLALAQATRGAQALPSRLFGVYGWNPDSALERSAAVTAGTGLAQVAVNWREIEFAEAYNDVSFGQIAHFNSVRIAPVDARMRAVADDGFQPVILVTNPPDWAVVTPGTQGPLRAEKVAKYADFVARLVQRYGERPYNARHVVLWPEPDHRGTIPAGCTGQPLHRAWGDVPAQFASMLSQTYGVVKAARADVEVVMGALAYDNWGGANRPSFNSSACGPFNYTFLDEVLAAGGNAYVDAYAFNSYAIYSVGWEQNSTGYDVAAKTNYLRQRFPAIIPKPLYVLEGGVWSDASVALPVLQGDRATVSTVVPNEDWQAAYAAKYLTRGLTANLSAVFWYGLRDHAGDVQRGLLDQAGRPKKAHTAYAHATRLLGSATYVSGLITGSVSSGAPEGYVFSLPSGGRMAVVWAIGDASARSAFTFDLPGGGVRAYDVLGNAAPGVQVSGDTVTVEATYSPLFVISGRPVFRTGVPLAARGSGP